jgi:predicted N-acyltransferase
MPSIILKNRRFGHKNEIVRSPPKAHIEGMSPTFREIEIAHSLSDIKADEWNNLACGDFVFANYFFLKSLEDSGCLGRRTGWHPVFLLARAANGHLEGALPLFLKSNSYGEYIFDWAWANAAESSGISYYPKLTSAIPFTPATGPKFLIHPQADRETVANRLLEKALSLGQEAEVSSTHFLFITPSESAHLEQAGFVIRHSFQYHWQNRGWKSFDDFLASLRSKRRTDIRRERESVRAQNIRIEAFSGASLTAEHAAIMHEFYSSTVAKMGGIAYLTKNFFALLFERMNQNILLFLAFDPNGEPVAGALNLFKGETLFGRNWGCHRDYPNLHFELCYYSAIEWAIANGITLFEAGAQGEHKFSRGFSPALCLSAHKLDNPDLHRAVTDFIHQEQSGIKDLFDDYRAHDPYKQITTSSLQTTPQILIKS